MINTKKSTQGFVGGVAVLTVSAAVVKLIGLFYKIPLIHLIGIEGMAYFLAAYHIYTLLFTISTAGLPVAVSILVSKSLAIGNEYAVEKIYRSSLLLFSSIGAACCITLTVAARPIASSINIPEAYLCIRAIAPSLVFVAAGSAVKGYFQGRQNMRPTGISQIIEAACKLGLGLLFTVYAKKQGRSLPEIAAAAIFGLTCGVIISTLYLFLSVSNHPKDRSKGKNCDIKVKKIIGWILSVSAPVTLSAAVISMTSFADTVLISSRLQHAGYSTPVANAMYSSYGNLSVPIFNLVPAFVSPIAVSIAPMISEAAAKRDLARQRKLMASAFRIVGLVAIPSAIGIATFGYEILRLVFPHQTEAVSIAAPLLTVLAPAIFFSCLITLTNAILQAYGKAGKSIVSTAVGASLKIVSEFFLVGIPSINIFGAPISTLICDVAIVTFNLYFVFKYTSVAERVISLFGKTLAAAGISTVFTSFAVGFVKTKYVVLIAVAINVAAYLLVTVISGSLLQDDVEMLPKGKKIYRVLQKLKFAK